jgi:two-component system copper resistance phosphate regulon response regulator CusR
MYFRCMKQADILLIEDEPKLSASISMFLEEHGFAVDVATDGAVGKHLGSNKGYDLILMDINLPYLDGYQVSREIRAVFPNVPIIMITAYGAIDQKLAGFDAGADDYMVKPFDFRELLARIRTLVKRNLQQYRDADEGILRVADMVIDTAFKSVKRGNQEISLTAKEYALLEFLVRNKGRIASRYEIAENVWDVNFDTGTNVVEVYINFLRKKIDKSFETKLIHTKQGMGYYIKE